MDGDPREADDSIVCHIYSIVCSLEVLRRLERLSLGDLKCGINFLECALWSRKVTFATPRIARISVKRRAKVLLIKDYACKIIYELLKFDFSSDLRDF